MLVLGESDTRGNLLYFEVPFACFDVVAAWDEHRNHWLATDNGLAVASWLTAYDQWPSNWAAIIQVCGVSCCQEMFYAYGKQADEVARRLIVALLYLDQVRRQPASCLPSSDLFWRGGVIQESGESYVAIP